MTDTTDDAALREAYDAFWKGAHELPDRTKRKMSVRELREIAQAVVPRILAARGDGQADPEAMARLSRTCMRALDRVEDLLDEKERLEAELAAASAKISEEPPS